MREASQRGIRDPRRSILDDLLSNSGKPEEEFLRPDLRARDPLITPMVGANQ